MASQDIRQLLLQVDASVALAQRNLNTLHSQVDRQTKDMENALQRPEQALDRMTRNFEANARRGAASIGQYRAGMQQLGFQIGDIGQQLAAGTRPMLVFAQQSGQVIQAIGMMQGEARGLIGFLGGPWGAVLISAISILGNLATSNNRGTDSTRRHKTAQQELREAILESRAALEENIRTSGAMINRNNLLAQSALRVAQAEREKARSRLQTSLSAARSEYETLRNLPRESSGVAAENALRRVQAIQNELGRLEREVQASERQLANSNIEFARAVNTPEGRLSYQYDIRQHNLEASHRRGEISARQLAEAERRLADERARALEAVSRSESSERRRTNQEAFRDFQRELRERGVEQAAGRSGFRTAADQNAQFRAGASPVDGYRSVSRHQTWQALDPTRASHSDRAAHEAAQAAGLRGFRIVRESGNRVHYQWTGHGAPGEVFASREETRRPPRPGDVDDPRNTASMLRANFERGYEDWLINGDTRDEIRADIEGLIASAERMGATFEDIRVPDLSDMLTIEDQRRIDQFVDDIHQNLSSGLAQAIVYGEDLGDVLENSFRRAAAALIESGLMQLLSGTGFRGKGGAGGVLDFISTALSTAFSYGGGMAQGGRVKPGVAYTVGEFGREQFVPNVPGYIVPNHALGGGQRVFDLRGAIVTSDLIRYLDQQTDAKIMRSAPKIAAAGGARAMREISRMPLS